MFSHAPGLDRPVDDAVEHVMAGFEQLMPHPDIAAGVAALAAAGHRLVTLSNGGIAVAEGLLERAGLRGSFDLLLTAQDAGAWKPHPRTYAHAASACGEPAADLVMVAVHPWDLDGAHRAGLTTAFLDRTGAPWPAVFAAPDVTIGRLADLPAALAAVAA